MKLDNIRKLVWESWNPAVETFLDSCFDDEDLPKEDQMSLLDGFEKGDAVDEKILETYLRHKHLLEEPELKLIELFEKRVKGASKMLQMLVENWIYRSSQLELAKLFHKRVKEAKELLLTYFSPKPGKKKHELCGGAVLELIKCFEEGVEGSQELLKVYVKEYQLPKACQKVLPKRFQKLQKGRKS